MSRGIKKALLALAILVALSALVLWLVRDPAAAPRDPGADGHRDHNAASGDPAGDEGRRGGRLVRFPSSSFDRARATQDRNAGPGTLEGRVLSFTTGEPIADAEITFARGGTISSAFTNMAGGFAFQASESGTYELVSVTAEGYLPFAPEWGHSPVRLEARRGYRIRDIIIHLRPVEELTGRVVDPSGQPAPGAEVEVISAPEGRSSLASFPDRFTSDERGEFQVQAPLGAVLEARHPEFSPGRARLDRAAVHRGSLEIRLEQGSERPAAEEIAGEVVDDRGRPVAGALVEAWFGLRSRRGLHTSGQALTDDDGLFVIEGLDRGRYHLRATAEGMTPGLAPGIVTGDHEVRIMVRPGAAVHGTVTDAASGDPVPGFSVVIEARRSPLYLTPYRTESVFDARGQFEVTGLEPLRYSVRITATGYSPSEPREIDISRGAREVRADFTLTRGGRANGVVIDAETGEPVPDAQVSVESRERPGTTPVPIAARTVTDYSGRFEIRGLDPGRRSLVVTARGYHQRILSALEVDEGGNLGPLEIELSPAPEGSEPELELTGIGAVLAPRLNDLMVVRVLEGGGAAEVGLAPGDRILRIDGRPVIDLGFNGAIESIRGREGTVVRLTVRRRGSGEEIDLNVPRRRVRG